MAAFDRLSEGGGLDLVPHLRTLVSFGMGVFSGIIMPFQFGTPTGPI